MTREEAIRILDPETTGEELAEIEYYGGFSGKTAAVQAVSDACILAVAALREQEQENEMVPKQDMETILHEVVNRAKPKWISVKDRLPLQSDPAQKVLFITKTGGLFIGCYYKATAYDQFNGWYSMFVRIDNVTHWMPLPEPPEEE